MRIKAARLAVYSAAHFVVDFACALLVYRGLRFGGDSAAAFLLYNYCAFALQMPIGLMADRLNRNGMLAAAGCALVALGYAFPSLPLPALVLSGLGNALFHVGGGLDVLGDSGAKAAPLGIYVSPGAAGIFFGTMLGKGAAFPEWAALLALSVCAVVILRLSRTADKTYRSGNPPLSFAGLNTPSALIPSFACLRWWCFAPTPA